jgi:hypothetical protein
MLDNTVTTQAFLKNTLIYHFFRIDVIERVGDLLRI